MLLKPWGVRFCPALPTTLPGWNASRNYACWTYFWRCIDYLWDVPSRRIKSFMFIPEKGGLNLSKGFFWDWRNENNTLFIFVLLAFTQRTWHTYIHTYTHTHIHTHTHAHTHTHHPNSHNLWQAALATAAGDTASEIPASLLGMDVTYSDQTMAKNDVVSAVCAIAPGDGTSGGSLPSQPMWFFKP